MTFGTCTAMDDRNKAVCYAAKTFCIFVNFMFNHKNTKQITRKKSLNIFHLT